jgi:hypothetical protein
MVASKLITKTLKQITASAALGWPEDPEGRSGRRELSTDVILNQSDKYIKYHVEKDVIDR